MAIADKLTKLQNDISDAYSTIEMKGGTIPTNKNTDSLSTAINSIPTEEQDVIEKDVTFYDYNGKRLYSYTKNEFLELEAMPANPTHEGLISQGWNYSLANAKTYIQEYGKLDIGQMYDTSHHGLNIIIYINKYLLSNFRITLSNSTSTGTINWGDGTTTNITSGSGNQYTHDFTEEGLYKIQIIPNGTITIATGFTPNEHKVRINAIEVGTNVSLSGEKVFQDFDILETITLPNKQGLITESHKYLFQYCRILNTIIIPKGVVKTAEYLFADCGALEHVIFCDDFNVSDDSKLCKYMFNNCSNIRNITLPNGIPTFTDYCLRYCYNFTKVVIPSTTTIINAYAFDSMRYVKVFDFTHHASIPTLKNTNAFGYVYGYKIVVPDNLYSSWIAANNWSSLSSNIVKESDFNL